jgi:hypothetical protein
MTPVECRARRETLNLTRAELLEAAGVSLWFIEALEDGAEHSVFVAGFKAEARKALREMPIDGLLAFFADRESLSGTTDWPRERSETD